MKNFLNKYCGKSLVVLVLFCSKVFAVQPDTMWTKTFGGTNIDVGYCVMQTTDGGYIICGYTRSYGAISGRNIWLIKTDSSGNQLWNNTFGGNSDDEAYSVQQTSDGGYILTGYTKSFGAGAADVILVKTDSLGNEIWSKTFGGASDEEGYGVVQLPGGDFVIAATTSSFGSGSRDAWLIKTDPSGNEIWKKTFGGLSSDGARSLQQTFDGGFIMTGWTFSYGPGYVGNAWLLKTDSAGTQEWNKYFGGTDADRGLSVQQTSDSGYVLTGYTASSGAGLDDLLLIKTNRSGIQEWYKTFGGTGRDYGNCVQQTIDGGFIVTGYTLSFGAGGDDLWVLKTDSSGVEEWNQTWGGLSSDVGYYIQQTSDAGFIITGHTLSFGAGVHDVWLLKLSPVIPVELTAFSGNIISGNVALQWRTASEINNMGFEIERKPSAENEWEIIGFINGKGTTTEKNNYYFVDDSGEPGLFNYRLKQIDFDGRFTYSQIIEINVVSPEGYALQQNFPNPFNPSTNIRYSIPSDLYVIIKVFDVLGNEITTLVNEEKPAGNYNITWTAENSPSGIYFYQISAGHFTETRRGVLLK